MRRGHSKTQLRDYLNVREILSAKYCVISYTIDANDRIDSIGGDWERFASMNETSQLAPERVMGSSIWQCIDGIDTAEIHRLLFAGVRDRDLQATLPFRCDGPRPSTQIGSRSD